MSKTLAEVLEGADDAGTVKAYLGQCAWQGIPRMHAEAAAARQKHSAPPGVDPTRHISSFLTFSCFRQSKFLQGLRQCLRP